MSTMTWAKGLLSARPAANSVSAGYGYFATDDNGGTLYVSDATSWYKQGAGATETGGVELGAATITTAFATSSTSYVDVTGLSAGFTADGGPVEIVVSGIMAAPLTTAAKTTWFAVVEGSTVLFEFGMNNTPGLGYQLTVTSVFRITPSAGAHTYKVQAKVSGGTNGGIAASASAPGLLVVRRG